VAVYNHYKRVQMMQAEDSDIELQKSNILLLGRRAAARRCSPRRSPASSTSVRDRRRHGAHGGGYVARTSRTSC